MAISAKVVRKLKEYLIDQHCVFFLKDMQVAVPSGDGEINVAGMLEGYVLDIDEENYYIGSAEGQFTRVISHAVANIVEIVGNEQDSYTDFEHPANGEEIH